MRRLRPAEGRQGLHIQVLPGLMIKMNNILMIRFPIEEAGHGAARRPGFLAGEELFSKGNRVFGKSGIFFAGINLRGCPARRCPVQGEAAVVRMLKIDGKLHPFFFKAFQCKAIVLAGRGIRFPGKRRIQLFQGAGSAGFNAGHQEVFKGVIVYPRGAVVKISDHAVAPAPYPGTGGAVAVTKPHPEHKIQSPYGFLHQPEIQCRFSLTDTPGVFQKGVYNLSRLKGLLADVAGVVPSAGIGELYAAVLCQNIPVTGAVAPAYRVAAALTVQKMEHFPHGLIEGMRRKRKRGRPERTGFQIIDPLFFERRKVPQIKSAFFRFG